MAIIYTQHTVRMHMFFLRVCIRRTRRRRRREGERQRERREEGTREADGWKYSLLNYSAGLESGVR